MRVRTTRACASRCNCNRFEDTGTDRLSDFLTTMGLARSPAAHVSESDLFRALAQLADIEIKRKSGGMPSDLALETFLLQRVRS